MTYRLGIDVGGTFTDFVLVDQKGRVTEAKTPSTSTDPGKAISKGLKEIASRLGISTAELLADCQLLIHGTTIALNTLIQRSGAKTGLICTEGFRDALEIRRSYRDVRYDFRHLPPPALVPRFLRVPVRERVDKNGQVVIPLSEDDVRRAVDIFKREEVQAVAVCLLWSFYNPAHERRSAEILREEMHEAFVSLSVDVAPQIREYDRVSTTVLNAYVGPRLNDYLRQVEELLRLLGYRGEIRYLQPNGGVAASEVIAARPILALNSGPAAGPAAGHFFGRQLDCDNLITMDMGGTSFDVCLINHGATEIKGTSDFQGYRLATPMVNINTIGAGGGSIASLDHGILRVGPQSAEAVPGPACYNRGGTAPTVTDADVVLGYLNPEALLGGKFQIDAFLAHKVIEENIARPLNMTVPQAALGIFEVVNHNMANAISEISLQRGYDPRDFVLVAAGGQGPVHAGELARALNIPRVIIPKLASTFCAFGALVTDLRHDYKRSFAFRLADLDLEPLERMFLEIEEEGYGELALEGIKSREALVTRSLEMRYVGQIYEVSVDVSDLKLTPDAVPEIQERLHQQHEKEYTYRHETGVGEIINATVSLLGRLPEIQLPVHDTSVTDASGAHVGERRVLFPGLGKPLSIPIYDGAQLRPGNLVAGPAVVEENNTTIVVYPDFELELTPRNAYLMRLA